MKTFIAVAALLLLAFWWWRRRRLIQVQDGVSMIRGGDRDMERAMAHARENFHQFVARLRAPAPGEENFAIKARIEHAGEIEHIWLGDVEVGESRFSGTLGNDPQMVPFKLGERWSGDLSQVSDWMYFDNGRMQGNFTLRAMLPRMPRGQREEMQRMLAAHWDTRELAHRPWPADATMPGKALSGEPSTGDGALMEGIGAHLDAHLGKCPQVFHELVSPGAHIDLYPYPATAARPFHVVATTGMAEQPMQLPPGAPDSAHVELVLLLPSSWPLDSKSWEDEAHWWPLRWLKRVARFHYETGRWLGEGHLLMHGAEPTPIAPSVAFDSVVLAPPRALPEAFGSATLRDGRSVRMLCLYFLDARERAELQQQGWPAFSARLGPQRLSL